MITLANYSLYIEKEVILNNISFSVNKYGLISICGESGSGKTTILNIIDGIKPEKKISEKGNVEVPLPSLIHYITVDDNVIGILSVLDNLKLCSNNKNDIEAVINELGLRDLQNTKCSLLSKGERERVAIACGLLDNNKILLIDEPTANLDAKSSELVFSILKKYSTNKSIIIATHDLDLANKYSDRIIEICKGQKTKDNTISSSLEEPIKNNSNRIFPFIQYFKISFRQLLSNKVGLILSSLLLSISLLITFIGFSFAYISSELTFKNLIREENGAYVFVNDKYYDKEQEGYENYIAEQYSSNKDEIIPLISLNNKGISIYTAYNTFINDEEINDKISQFNNTNSNSLSFPIYLSETYLQKSETTFNIGDKVSFTYENYSEYEFVYDGSFKDVSNDLVEAIIPEDIRVEKYELYFNSNDFKNNLNVYDIRSSIYDLGSSELIDLVENMNLGNIIKPYTEDISLKYGEIKNLERGEIIISNDNMYDLLFSDKYPEIESLVKPYREEISFTKKTYYLSDMPNSFKIVGCAENEDVVYINPELYEEIAEKAVAANYDDYTLTMKTEYVTDNIDKVLNDNWNINNSYYYDLYNANNNQARIIIIVSIFVFILTIGSTVFYFNNIIKKNQKNFALLTLIGKSPFESACVNFFSSITLSIIPLTITYSLGTTSVYSIKKLFNKLLTDDINITFVNNIAFGFVEAYILTFIFIFILANIITIFSIINKRDKIKHLKYE